MSTVSRRVRAVPFRTSVEAWNAIVKLLTTPSDPSRFELAAITSTAAMIIAEEYTRDAPIVVMPASGPRVRIYTLHGEAALDEQDDAAPLASWPLDMPGWSVSLPCGIDDIEHVRAALEQHPSISVRDLTEGITVDASAMSHHSAGTVLINYDELERS